MRFAILALGVCGVASAALFARIGLDAGVSPASMAAWRLTIACVALLAFLGARRSFGGMSRGDILRLAGAGAFLAVHFVTWIASLEYVSVARSTLLVATAPLWAGLVGLFVPSLRPAKWFWAGLPVALLGTAMVTTQGLAGAHRSPAWLGDLLAVIGALCIVPYLLFSQDVQKRLGTLKTVTWIYTFAAMSIWLWLVPQRPPMPNTSDAWFSILGMAVLAQLLGHSSLNWALKHFSAAQVATTTLLEPVFAAALAWIVLAERVTWLQALGGAVMLVGVGTCLRSEREPVTAEL